MTIKVKSNKIVFWKLLFVISKLLYKLKHLKVSCESLTDLKIFLCWK